MTNTETALSTEEQEHLLEIARANFETWNDALQTGSPSTVAELYVESATFLPTVATRKEGRSGAQDYFVHFLAKKPHGTITEETAQKTPGRDDMIIHTGLYNFELDGDDGRTVVHARFSFVWVLINNEWKILHHHSSLDPERQTIA